MRALSALTILCDVMKDAKENENVVSYVKCFFLITFSTLLMSSTQHYLVVSQMQAGMELERIFKIIWRKVVLNLLVQGVTA